MNKNIGIFKFKLLAFITISLVASQLIAINPEMPIAPSALQLRKTGVVQVNRDKSDKVVSIKLIVTSYDITLDEGSKPLEELDGQKVKVIGTYKREGGRRWFTVKKVDEVLSEKEKQPEKQELKKASEKKPEKKLKKLPEEPSKELGK